MASHPTIGQTEEQRQAAFEAAGLSTTQRFATKAGISAPFGAIPIPTAITSEAITPTSPLTVADVPETITPDVKDIPLVEIEPEKEIEAPRATDLERRLTETQTRLAGFDVERERAITPEVVIARRKLLEINKRIQLQQVKAQRAEEAALRRGRTLTFARGEAAIVRREAAFDALTLAAIGQFAQGNVLLARDLAKDAVAAKFDQEKKERDTARQNLIDNFDSFTAKEKKRALATLARFDEGDKFLLLEEQKTEDITNVITLAVGNGLTNPDIIEQMQKADSGIEATIIATKAGFGAKDKLLSVSEAKALKVPFGTTQQEAFGITPQAAGALADLTPAQQTAAFKLADDFEQVSKDFFKVRAAQGRVVASAEDPSAAGDLALIFNFMKVLDPGSVVREGEFATAASAGSVPQRTIALYNKVLEGTRLSQAQRSDFVNRATKLFNAALEQQQSVVKTFADRAEAFGIPSSFVVRDIEAKAAAPSVVKKTDEELKEEFSGLIKSGDIIEEDKPGGIFNFLINLFR